MKNSRKMVQREIERRKRERRSGIGMRNRGGLDKFGGAEKREKVMARGVGIEKEKGMK